MKSSIVISYSKVRDKKQMFICFLKKIKTILMIGRLPLISCACMYATSLPVSAQQQSASRPNIIFLLADDLGYSDVGFNGQQFIRTPNLDELAKEGMNFTQFYAGTAVCSPSRSSLITGQHTGHTYIRGNKATPPEGQEPLINSGKNLAEVLQKAGYVIAAFGKWGLGGIHSMGDPIRQGFDIFFGYNDQSLAHRYYPDHLWYNDKKIELKDNDSFRKQITYSADLIQQKALHFLDDASKDKPFFLFLPYTLPHAELIVPDDSIFESYKGKFPEKPYKGQDYDGPHTGHGYTSQQYPHATFAAMVTRLDMYLGQIMEKLRQRGLDKNTLVIFTSDNGPHIEGGADPAFFHSSGIYRGVKRDLYEGGIREPFVAWWPGVIQPHSASNFAGAFWDMLPTFANLAGAPVPDNIDGISFLPSLTGKGRQQQHPYLYWELHESGGKQAVRMGKWKAVRLHADAGPIKATTELYDMDKDPGEKNNVASQYPDIIKKLEAIMDKAHSPSPLFPFKYEEKKPLIKN